MAVYVSGAPMEETETTTAKMTTTTPVVIEILKQINEVNDDGSYTFGFEAADGSFKVETRDIDGNVKGKYGYLDEFGDIKTVEYTAGKAGGFTAEGDHLPEPVAPLPVAPLPAPLAPAPPTPSTQSFNNFPTQQFAPQQFPAQQFNQQQAPQQFAPQQFAPQQIAPQQFAPQQFSPQQFAPQQVPQQFNGNSSPLGVRAPPTPAPQQFNQFAGQQFGSPQQFAPNQFSPQQFQGVDNSIDNRNRRQGFALQGFPQQQQQPQSFNSFQ